MAGNRRGVDIAVICALEVERLAVCRTFGMTSPQDRQTVEDRRYWHGVRSFGNTSPSFDIVIAQLPEMRNTPAAVTTARVIHHWRPRALLLVGIAAAMSTKQQLGDVVVGRTVYYEEGGKQTPRGKQHDPDMVHADPKILDIARSAKAWSGRFRVPRPDGTDQVSQSSIGVIASGEEVIANTTFRDDIKRHKRSAIAVEMEGYGFSYAALHGTPVAQHLVIRGLCDYANASKNDKWHPYAAAAAASYARHLLADWPYRTIADRSAIGQPTAGRRSARAHPLASSELRPVTLLVPKADTADTRSGSSELDTFVAAIAATRVAITRAARSAPSAAADALVRHYASDLADRLALIVDLPRGWRSLGADQLRLVDAAVSARDQAIAICHSVHSTVDDVRARVDALNVTLDRLDVLTEGSRAGLAPDNADD